MQVRLPDGPWVVGDGCSLVVLGVGDWRGGDSSCWDSLLTCYYYCYTESTTLVEQSQSQQPQTIVSTGSPPLSSTPPATSILADDDDKTTAMVKRFKFQKTYVYNYVHVSLIPPPTHACRTDNGTSEILLFSLDYRERAALFFFQ